MIDVSDKAGLQIATGQHRNDRRSQFGSVIVQISVSLNLVRCQPRWVTSLRIRILAMSYSFWLNSAILVNLAVAWRLRLQDIEDATDRAGMM